MTQFKKKILLAAGTSITSLGFLLTPSLTPAAAAAESINTQAVAMPVPPAVLAKSVVVMDADNGQILYQKNAQERRAPASTTKLMTMLLIEKAVQDHQASWSDDVPITPDAYKVAVEPGVSDAFLDPREHFTLQEMMELIAVVSANDATVAVADKLGGDKASFANLMNEEAKQIGLTGTHYMNPDGLPQPGHYTTAIDLAKLARYLITSYPQILKYTSMAQVTVKEDSIRKSVTWPNTDQMLGSYPGIDGLKTGFTADAGYCFVGTAHQKGRRLITVVMGDTSEQQRFIDTAKLFDWGFGQFQRVTAEQPGQALSQTVYVDNGSSRHLKVTAPNGLMVDLPNGVKGQTVLKVNQLTAPIKQNETVGELDYVVNGKVVANSPVLAAQNDGKANFFIRWCRGIGDWFAHLLHK